MVECHACGGAAEPSDRCVGGCSWGMVPTEDGRQAEIDDELEAADAWLDARNDDRD